LLYNPNSGQHFTGHRAIIERVVDALSAAGVESQEFRTTLSVGAETLARQAVSEGFDTVFACGGDGTVHDTLQGLAGTNTPLGVIPLGTANALASNLGLRGSPESIVTKLLRAIPTRVPVGCILFDADDGVRHTKYFIVAAGAGADALLLSRLDVRLKRKLGYLLYLFEGVRVWASFGFPLFECECVDSATGDRRLLQASQLLAVRIRDFGGVLHRMAPGATVHGNDLCLVAFKTRRRLAYFRFMISVMLGRQTFSGSVELLNAKSVKCRPLNGSSNLTLVEADGEVLGRLPVELKIAQDALTLLIPSGAQP